MPPMAQDIRVQLVTRPAIDLSGEGKCTAFDLVWHIGWRFSQPSRSLAQLSLALFSLFSFSPQPPIFAEPIPIQLFCIWAFEMFLDVFEQLPYHRLSVTQDIRFIV